MGGKNTSSQRFMGGSSLPGKIKTGSPSLPDMDMPNSSLTGEVTAGYSLTGEVGVSSSFSLAEFYEAIADDVRIGPTHICLYVALLNEWDMACANEAIAMDRNVLMKMDSIPLERNAIMKKDSIPLDRNVLMKKDSIPLDRNLLMKNARISRRTYHKCMRELHEYGYIRYEPSSNPFFRSRVYLKRL